MRAWLLSFRPSGQSYRASEFVRGGLGGLLGIVIAGLAGKGLHVGDAALPFIVAPLGASAVLLFAASASPLAQPWPVIGGNVVSSFVGVAAGRLIHVPVLAGAAAVGAAIALMMVLRCLHPPGGACALFAAVATPVVHHEGFLFPLFPVAVNTVAILAVALAVNNATGRRYPHVPAVPTPPKVGTDDAPSERIGLQADDVAAAMARLDQGLDILPADVLALMRDAEEHAIDRQLGRLKVGTLMARDVLTVLPTETVYRVRLIMTQHHVKAVPVLDVERHVVGIITVADMLNLTLANVAQAQSIMSSPVVTIEADAPVARLVSLMSDRGLRHLPVVDEERRMVGIVTRSELVAVLNQALVRAGASLS
jgi:CBS domain-containing membrane protein